MRIFLAVLFLLAIGGFCYCETSYIVHDRDVRILRLRVISRSAVPIQEVGLEVFDDLEAARYPLEHLAIRLGGYSPTSRTDTLTERKQIPIQIDTQRSWLGRDAGYTQQHVLLVVVEYADGSRAGQLFDVPDMRVFDQMTVIVDPPGAATARTTKHSSQPSAATTAGHP